MKLSNKRELQQIAFNHSSDIDFRDFRNTYKKCPIKPYSFLETDTILLLHQIIFQVQKESFRKNIYIYKKIMTIDNKIRDEKPQYDVISIIIR